MNVVSSAADNTAPQKSATWIASLILVVVGLIQLVRICQVQSATGETPFLSANDRSRWCTIAVLAVNGSYEIDEVLAIRDPVTRRRTWYTIDLVQHRGRDGEQHFYSSKPPLLPTLYAGVYMAVRSITGYTLMSQPFIVVPIVLVIVNLIPLLLFWFFMVRWLGQQTQGNWATIILAVVVSSATFLTTFVTTLNNHLPAAFAAGISLWCLERILIKQDERVRWFALSGLATSFCAANELPALSWVCAVGVMLAIADVRKSLVYAASLLPVAIAFFGLNYVAHGEFAPAYAHRSAGERLFQIQLDWKTGDALPPAKMIIEQFQAQGVDCSSESELRVARRPDTYELWDPKSQIRYALKPNVVGDLSALNVHRWGDWYDYPGSYWTKDRKQGVDKGEPNRGLYIFHSLIGHHGILSLTPYWWVAICGVAIIFRDRVSLNIFKDRRLLIAAAVGATTMVVVGFYLSRGLEDRNYGGVSSGFRWAFWLIPFWLWLSMHTLQRIQAAWQRRVVEGLVVLSIFSASYPWSNPWTSPWLMQLGEQQGWF